MTDRRLTIREATLDRAAEVLSILDDACEWLRSRGIRQWPDRMQPEWIAPALARGETWLASWGAAPPVGTITLSWSDRAWVDDSRGAGAGYVHRLAGRRPTGGIGSALLSWAAAQCRDRGLHYLRLDCVTTNRQLRRYYEQRGFVHQRDVVVIGPPLDREQCQVAGVPTSVSLYEMVLS